MSFRLPTGTSTDRRVPASKWVGLLYNVESPSAFVAENDAHTCLIHQSKCRLHSVGQRDFQCFRYSAVHWEGYYVATSGALIFSFVRQKSPLGHGLVRSFVCLFFQLLTPTLATLSISVSSMSTDSTS